MLFVGRLSGQDYNWDLLNYHYVSPYLLLSGGYDRNLAPSGLQSWFNPIGYVPAYLAITFLPPWLASTLFAIVAGLNAPLIYLIADRIGEGLPEEARPLTGVACVATGMTGALTLSEAGTSFLDDVLSIAILGAVLAMMMAVRSPDPARRTSGIAIAGLLLGAVCGVKLTNIVMATGMTLALVALVLGRRVPVSALVVFALAGVAGFVVTGGWWAWRLWTAFHNPAFPLFNELFRSPLAPSASQVDRNFLPRDWTGIFTFPWHLLIGDVTPGAEIPIRDPRYAVILLASLLVCVAALARRRRAPNGQDEALSIALFCVLTYLIWLFAFAILRYVVVLEMMSGIVLLAALRLLPSRYDRRIPMLMILAAFGILLGTRHATWGRVPFAGDWFGVRGIEQVHQPGTVYVLPDDAPLGFLLAAFPADARFVRIGGNFPLTPGMGLGVRAAGMIGTAPRLRSLAAAPDSPAGVAALFRFGLAATPGSCRIILTKMAKVESCALSARPGLRPTAR